MAHKKKPARARPPKDVRAWELRLYVAHWEPRSAEAWDNLKKLCDQYLPGLYKIELVDLVRDPKQAREHQIVAVPTLIRTSPLPEKRVVGKLSDSERVIASLGLRAARNSEPGRRTSRQGG